MNTLIALASQVLDDEQDAAAPRRSRTPKRAAPKRAAPKRGRKAQAAEAVAVAVPSTGRDSSREALEGRVEAAPTRGRSRERSKPVRSTLQLRQRVPRRTQSTPAATAVPVPPVPAVVAPPRSQSAQPKRRVRAKTPQPGSAAAAAAEVPQPAAAAAADTQPIRRSITSKRPDPGFPPAAEQPPKRARDDRGRFIPANHHRQQWTRLVQ